MKISQLHISNLLGVDEARLECGQITVLSGRNASRKTSILQALQAGLGGGDLGKLKRVGAEAEPEVVLVLRDEDGHHYRVERKGKETRVSEQVGQSAAYDTVRRPQSFLDSLYDAQLSNPLRFLAAPANTRADLLLEVLPIEIDVEAFGAQVGPDAWRVVAETMQAMLRKGIHPLEVLASARALIYDERTGVNRSYQDKRRSAEQLARAIPAEMPEAGNGTLERLEAERDRSADRIAGLRERAEAGHREALSVARAEMDGAVESIKAGFKAGAAKIRSAHETTIRERQARLEQEIARLRTEAQQDIDLLRKQEDAEVQALRDSCEERIECAEAAYDGAEREASRARAEALAEVAALEPAHQELVERVSRLRSEQEQTAKLQALKDQADKFAAEADSLHGMSDRLTVGLGALDIYKAKLLEQLPIPGLEVQGKDIAINGVPFDQVNTAEQIKIAVQLAVLRAKGQRLPVLFVDGAERLDAEAFKVLIQELEATGVQTFISRVTTGDLQIERLPRAS